MNRLKWASDRRSGKMPLMKNYLPPEWAPQSAVMLTWPHQHGHWKPYFPAVDIAFTEIARQTALYEFVLIAYYEPAHRDHIKSLLEAAQADLKQIHFFEAKSNDLWVRDHGPISILRDGKPVLLDFDFNAWGGKYSFEYDNTLTRTLHAQHAFPKSSIERVPFVLEGGGIEVDGKGTLLTTDSVMLAATRNQTTREDVVRLLKKMCGIDRVLWLQHGHLVGDDTDGHIDTLVRFVDPYTLCYVACDDKTDEHYQALKLMEAELQAFRNFEGEPYRLIPLPMPEAQYSPKGQRLPATYANFLIINGAILMPIYGTPQDILAEKILATCFPDRQIISINCRVLINIYGSLHCATMQLPQGMI
jgi:agmatine deiminase